MKKIALACAIAADAFGKHLGALDTYVVEGNKSMLFGVETRLSKIEFVYTLKGRAVCPKSTLFVRLYPQKNRPLFLHLYELAREDDFRCTYFPMIASPEQMNVCFDTLSAIVEEYLPALEALALDETAYEARLSEKRKAILRCANIQEEKVPQDPELAADFWVTWEDFYEQFAQLSFFTNYAGYTAFLQGNLAKAKKLYAKRAAKGDMLPYEQRLLAFLQTPAAAEFAPLPPACAALLEAQAFSNGKEEDKLLFVTGSLCYGVALAAGWLIVGAVYLLCGRGTVYFPVDWPFFFLLPLLPAMFGSVALRRLCIPLVFRGEAERVAAVDALVNGKRVSGIALMLTGLMTVAFLFFTLVFAACAPRLYTDRMVYDDAARFPLLNPVTYAYENVERVCYLEGRYNVYDELVERGSYVLIFTDGRVIDLDGTLSVKETETYVLTYVVTNETVISRYESDRDLAAEYGKDPEIFFGYGDVAW